jgi:hypothetical protein
VSRRLLFARWKLLARAVLHDGKRLQRRAMLRPNDAQVRRLPVYRGARTRRLRSRQVLPGRRDVHGGPVLRGRGLFGRRVLHQQPVRGELLHDEQRLHGGPVLRPGQPTVWDVPVQRRAGQGRLPHRPVLQEFGHVHAGDVLR